VHRRGRCEDGREKEEQRIDAVDGEKAGIGTEGGLKRKELKESGDIKAKKKKTRPH